MAKNHTVCQGDSMASLAKKYGFIYQQLWEHAKNADLKELRGNPNILLEGDVVYIPDIEIKELQVATEQRHRYRRKGIPSKLQLQLLAEGEPRVGLEFEITFDDDSVVTGQTDADGYVKASVQPERTSAVVVVQGRHEEEIYKIALGTMDPIDTLTGMQQRLINLGYDGKVTGELDKKTVKMLKGFQGKQELDVTGEPDDATQEKLLQVCGA